MPKILDRLVSQLKNKGASEKQAYAMAVAGLQKAKVLKKGTTELTEYGKKRNSMSAADRAKERASRESGKPVKNYKYNPRTNRATLKKDK